MTGQPSNRDVIQDTLKTSAASAGFWSAISAVVGLVASVAGIILVLTIDEIRGFALTVLIIGLVLLFVALVLSPRAVAIFMVGRRGLYGVNAIVMTLAFLGIAMLVNFQFFRDSTRIDLTSTRVFSLSPQTEQILDRLSSPVRANAFFVPNDPQNAFALQQAEDLLNEFHRRSSNFTYRFVDPQLERERALQYGVVNYPTIVFEDVETGNQEGVFNYTEQDFLTGLLVATGIQQKRVYFLTGHGEAFLTRDPATGEIDPNGFDFAREGLLRDNYQVWPLNLRQDLAVPADAAVLVIAGPDQDLSIAELDAIMQYMLDGGKLIALLDTGAPDTYRQFLIRWGIQIFTESVADIVSNVAGEQLTPMVQKSNLQFTTSGISGIPIADQVNVAFFPGVTALTLAVPIEDLPPFIIYNGLAASTPASWLETDPDEVEFDSDIDLGGPLDLAVVVQAGGTLDGQVVTNPDSLAKLVVFGDADFARNGFFFSSENADLLLNSVNWLAEDFDLIAVRPKLVPFRELVVNQRERNFIKWSSWLVPPVIMLFLGVFVWWRRR